MAAQFFRGCEPEWKDFTIRCQQEKLNFIVQLGVETIAKIQIHYSGFGSAFFKLSSNFKL
jgi:hypothetical protein